MSIELLLILFSMALGSFIKGVTGSGLPALAVPVMAASIGVESAVVVIAIPLIVTNSWLINHHRAYRFQTRDLSVLIVTGIAGTIYGTWLLKTLNSDHLSVILAGIIFLYISLFLWKPKLSLPPEIARFGSPGVGVIAGILQGSTGVSGPVLMVYLHSFRLQKEAYIFSISLLFQIFAVAQTLALLGLGLFTTERLLYSGLSLIPILLMLRLGAAFGSKVSGRAFDLAIMALLFVTALKLLYDGALA